MSRLSRVRKGATRSASTLSNPAEWLVTTLTGSRIASGQKVTVNSALGLAPFYRGVQLLSGSVGMLPCKVYRKTADGRVEAPSTSRAWQLLHDKPNRDQAADEFWALVESHLDTWGNAFVWKERGGDGRVSNLWPLCPSRFQVRRRSDGAREFVVDGDEGSPFTDVDILHIRGLSTDGLVGYPPVHLHRNGLGTAQAQQEFEGKFWENDATPGVTLIHPGTGANKLSPDGTERLRALWDNRHRGGPNRHKTAVLGEDVKVQQMTMPLKDAQYIEGKRMSATEQALMLGIPPYMVAGDSGGNSLTYSTVEGQSVDFLKWSLSPRLVRIQRAVTWDPDLMPSNWEAEFDTGALLRATTKESYEALALADFMLIDEKRKKAGLEPLPDGAGQVLAKPVTKPATNGGDTPADGGNQQ